MDKEPTKLAISVVLPYDDNKFIYVRTAKDNKLGLPGGKVDPYEEASLGAMREVKQETGLYVVLKDFIGIWDFKSEGSNSISNRVFSGDIVGGEMRLTKTNEILEVRAFSFPELMDLYEKGEIRAGRANIEPVIEFLRGTKYPINNIIHTHF